MRCVVVRPFTRRGGQIDVGEVIDAPVETVPALKNFVAWLDGDGLQCRRPVPDLAAVIVRLTGEDLNLQRRLLVEYCEAFDDNHIWHLIERWEERAAILEYDAGLPRHEAELEAARMYHLTAWLPDLRKGNRDHD